METNLKELELLGLTERDFQLIIEGLDALPNRSDASNLINDLVMKIAFKDEAKEDFKKSRETENLKREKEKQILTEETKILQGKLLSFKRYMQKNDLIAKSN